MRAAMNKLLRSVGPFLLLAAVVAFLATFLGPESRNDSHFWRGVLGAVGVVLAVGWACAASLREEARRVSLPVVRGALVVTVVLGWFNYYQFDRKVLDGVSDYTDITYYYVNSKYLGELGYYNLYPAMIVADAEGERRHSDHIRQYRDLRDYEVKPVAVAMEHGQEIKKTRFTPERWAEFSHDIDFFISRLSKRSMRSNFYVDHGYNPPPTWSVGGATLANLVPVEHLKSIALVDVGLVAAMFATVAWAFGFDTMLFGMLFFVCTFSGRWPILGDALLRFDWLAALVIGMCLLKKEKWFLAGMFLSFASLNRIFPTIFFFGWGAVVLRDLWTTRRLADRHLQVIGGAGLVAALLIGVALVRFGPETFKQSSQNLLMHNKSYSSHRVGLGDLALFRGEKTRTEMAKTVYAHGPGDKPTRGVQAKEYILRHNQTWLRLAAVLALIFLTAYALRTRREAWELLPLAILPFYCATNPQINYYNLRLLLFVWHGWRLVAKDSTAETRFAHASGLAMLFLVEAATQFAHLEEVPHPRRDGKVGPVERYFVTSTTSVWMAVYFTGLIAGLIGDGWVMNARRRLGLLPERA